MPGERVSEAAARHLPTVRPLEGPVELRDEHDKVVYIADPNNPNGFVKVSRADLLAAMQAHAAAMAPAPAPVQPRPGMDVWAQRGAGVGVGAGVAAWGGGHLLAGAGQMLSAAAGAGSFVAAVALLLLVAKLTPSGRAGGGKSVQVTNNFKYGGRSHVE